MTTRFVIWSPVSSLVSALAVGALSLGLCACQPHTKTQSLPTAGAVDARRLAKAADEPDQWLTAGRDGGGTYYSPLTDINTDNVKQLGLAWVIETGSVQRPSSRASAKVTIGTAG